MINRFREMIPGFGGRKDNKPSVETEPTPDQIALEAVNLFKEAEKQDSILEFPANKQNTFDLSKQTNPLGTIIRVVHKEISLAAEANLEEEKNPNLYSFFVIVISSDRTPKVWRMKGKWGEKAGNYPLDAEFRTPFPTLIEVPYRETDCPVESFLDNLNLKPKDSNLRAEVIKIDLMSGGVIEKTKLKSPIRASDITPVSIPGLMPKGFPAG